MSVVNSSTGTRVDEIAPGIHRISTPVSPEAMPPVGFTFNQFLLVDEQPLLFHTGLHRMFPLTLGAVRTIMPPERLRWIAFSHYEADECGALNEWLAVAPRARPLCSAMAAMLSIDDVADRPARGLADGESVSLGRMSVTWLDAPHVPHGMECGYLFETTTRTLLCGDLLTQPGATPPPLADDPEIIWGPSEAMRQEFPYAPVSNAASLVERLAATEPHVLACMHGASYRGDGGSLLRRLSAALAA